jgi:hypothetical protein
MVSFIAQGSMAQATAELATGHVSSLRSAWGAGVHLFWRYVGLWLACVATVVLVAAVALILGFVVVVLRLIETTHVPRWLVALGAARLALPVFTVVIAVGLTLSIVVEFGNAPLRSRTWVRWSGSGPVGG